MSIFKSLVTGRGITLFRPVLPKRLLYLWLGKFGIGRHSSPIFSNGRLEFDYIEDRIRSAAVRIGVNNHLQQIMLAFFELIGGDIASRNRILLQIATVDCGSVFRYILPNFAA